MTSALFNSFHERALGRAVSAAEVDPSTGTLEFTFRTFHHPLVDDLAARLARASLTGMLDPAWQRSREREYFGAAYDPRHDGTVTVDSEPERFDVSVGGPYSVYHWELCFHVPLTVAVTLSRAQRFAEAQRWFHLIFDPTTPDRDETVGIAQAAGPSGELHLCTATADGRLWHAVRDTGGTWSGPLADTRADVGDPGRVVGLDCAVTPDGDLHVCLVTAAGGLHHSVRRAADATWTPVGDVRAQIAETQRVTAVACAATSAGEVHVCYGRDGWGLPHTARRADGSWSPVEDLITAANVSTSVTALGCATTAADDLHVLFAGPSGTLGHTVLTRATGQWQNPAGDVLAQIGDPGAVVAVACTGGFDEDVHVCAVTAAGAVAHTIRHGVNGSWDTRVDVEAQAGDAARITTATCSPGAGGALELGVVSDPNGLVRTRRAADGRWDAVTRAGVYARDPARRFWRFMAFQDDHRPRRIDYLLGLLSRRPDDLSAEERRLRTEVLDGYAAVLDAPFQPHAVARTRPVAYQYSVVMKYLDNLIAWGDHLYQQNTMESINEATQRYVLASNLLGPRPQRVPPAGTVRPQTFADLRKRAADPLGNAVVELESRFPFNLDPDLTATPTAAEGAGPLFGIGRTLYFCLPRNEKLLGYWDVVADRLGKIRSGRTITGAVRPLDLYGSRIDPGALVAAAAGGIDVGAAVAGLNRPIGPVRSATLTGRAKELCAEVRAFGSALLSAIEKGDAEQLTLTRQRHEGAAARLGRDVRYLQWQAAREQTQSLLTTRRATLERMAFQRRALGLAADPDIAETLTLQRPELTEETFDALYAGLVTTYDKPLLRHPYPASTQPKSTSPQAESGAAGEGRLRLTPNEDLELNTLLPRARDTRRNAAIAEIAATVLTFVPEFNVELAFWGLGGSSTLFGGAKLSDAIKIGAEIARTNAAWDTDQAGIAARTAGYERRADDWLLQYNLAAHELMQNGRQILAGLLTEEVARHEYETVRRQIEQSDEVDRVLRTKFSGEQLYLWMQGETSRLFHEYYRLAVDTARRAERAMKHELMAPELDAVTFVADHWDAGRRGLLSGEALHLDVTRMELARLDADRREQAFTRHVSLRALDPVALLTLRATGSCEFAIPEWLFDRDCPGFYMRRLRSVALSLPAVLGPYTALHATLTLLGSSIRTSDVAGDDYARQGHDDPRFQDDPGGESIVTSGGIQDDGTSGDATDGDRYAPFECAGAISRWRIDLPTRFPSVDRTTLTDVVIHLQYTARLGLPPTTVENSLAELFGRLDGAPQALVLDLRRDFPTQWAAFVDGTERIQVTVDRDRFPYFTVGSTITVTSLELAGHHDRTLRRHATADPQIVTDALAADAAFTFTADPDAVGTNQALLRAPDAESFLIINYTLMTP